MTKPIKAIGGMLMLIATVATGVLVFQRGERMRMSRGPSGNLVRLPPPKTTGGMSVTEAIAKRRSQREFREQPLSQELISQLCWAAQGITDKNLGFRTAPSAGGLYPAVLFVVEQNGVFEYEPNTHALRHLSANDLRGELQKAAHDQPSVRSAPVCLVIAMDVNRTAAKYGSRAERYCLIEAGHIAQNVLLLTTSEGLGGVPVGAFDDQKISASLQLPANLRPVYLIPIGYAK